MPPIPRILITPGEPAGIGPDVLIKIAQEHWDAELVAIADPTILTARASQLNLPIALTECELNEYPSRNIAQSLKIIPINALSPAIPGQLNKDNSRYVLACLEKASDLCKEKKAQALVTGPVHKSIINEANVYFTGHTEFLAERCNVDQVIMLFVTSQTKVALVTTHLPLSAVPQAISIKKLTSIVRLLNSELQKQFKLHHPKILVCGLNPHAGEQGHLGLEELNIIEPTIKQLKNEGIHVTGPMPADTIFTPKYLKAHDVILAMYHDQALPVVKYMSFGHAVNVTLGLPFIRTSVDHGTALDIAGTGQADAGSLHAAIELALQLV